MRRAYREAPEWQRWFAWHPVSAWIGGTKNLVWWEWLEREWLTGADTGVWNYRAPAVSSAGLIRADLREKLHHPVWSRDGAKDALEALEEIESAFAEIQGILAALSAPQQPVNDGEARAALLDIITRHMPAGSDPSRAVAMASEIVRAQPVKLDAVREAWERLIADEAQLVAEDENEKEGHCGPYGTSTAAEYADDVRAKFEKIGKAYAALATPPLDNTGLDAATVELKHAARLLLWQYGVDATVLPYASEMWKALDAALESGDRS